eukprot:COSAG02_NODE_24197_length_695_cov_1.125839_2_plen_111_part_01
MQRYASSYTLSGCSNPAHCGVFMRVLAHCTPGSSEYCPGGRYASSNTDPTLCDGAPVYQQGDSDGPVLLRYGYHGSKEWFVADNGGPLVDCDIHNLPSTYLQSSSNVGRIG